MTPPIPGDLWRSAIDGSRGAAYYAFVPHGWSGEQLLVTVHGRSGHAERLLVSFLADAARSGLALVAMDYGTEPTGYQRLAWRGESLQAGRLLRRAVREVRQRYGATSTPFDLFGFSAGAQFAHRYAMVFPEDVRSLALGAPGWYTALDPTRPFPSGIAQSEALAGMTINAAAFCALSIRVFVGERDTGRGKMLRQGRRLDRSQGRNRVRRASRWVRSVESTAARLNQTPDIALQLLPATRHSFESAIRRGGLGRELFTFIAPSPRPPVWRPGDSCSDRN